MDKTFEKGLKNEIVSYLKTHYALDWKTANSIYKSVDYRKMYRLLEDAVGQIASNLHKEYLFQKTNHINLSEKYRRKKPDITVDWLEANFNRSGSLSDDHCSVYLRRFPASKWNGIITLDAEIKVYYPSKDIEVNCYDYGTNNPYAAFYYADCGDYTKLLESIDKRILAEFKKLGISI